MSIGSLGMIGSVAGSPLSQIKGDVDKAKETAAAQERQVDAQTQAEDAAGIGLTDGKNHETNERDADGQRLYEEPPTAGPKEEPAAEAVPQEMPPAVDPNGIRGSHLDLTG